MNFKRWAMLVAVYIIKIFAAIVALLTGHDDQIFWVEIRFQRMAVAVALLSQRFDILNKVLSELLAAPKSCRYQVLAAGSVGRGDPVFVVDAWRAKRLDGSAVGLRRFVGFAENAASDGGAFYIQRCAQVALFQNLAPGEEYFLTPAGAIVPFSAVAALSLFRGLGPALDPFTLDLERGPVIQKGAAGMPTSPAGIDNATGALIVDTNDIQTETGPAGAGFTGPKALYSNGTDLFPLDGTLANALKFVGISDASVYTLGATVTYYPPNSTIPDGVVSPDKPEGEIWANESGALGAFSTLAALNYGKMVGIVQPDGKIKVVGNGTVQHP